MNIAEFIPIFVALFVVIDPIGLTPIFVALTTGQSSAQRRAIAVRACFVAFALLCLFAILGENVLSFLGISLSAFRIAGGILLLLTAFDMLFDRRSERRKDNADGSPDDEDPSIFPLALPFLAGPGAIATMILLSGQADGAADVAMSIGAMFAVILLAFLFFSLATPIERLLGKVGINVVTRVLGMLLAALSIQFMIDGFVDLGLF